SPLRTPQVRAVRGGGSRRQAERRPSRDTRHRPPVPLIVRHRSLPVQRSPTRSATMQALCARGSDALGIGPPPTVEPHTPNLWSLAAPAAPCKRRPARQADRPPGPRIPPPRLAPP